MPTYSCLTARKPRPQQTFAATHVSKKSPFTKYIACQNLLIYSSPVAWSICAQWEVNENNITTPGISKLFSKVEAHP